MRIKMDVWLDVDKLTAERFLNATPANRWKMMNLIVNTRPDAVSYSEPIIKDEEGAPDETPPATSN